MEMLLFNSNCYQVHNEIVIHKCPHCFIEFHEYVDLLEHFKSHLGLKRIKCNLCRKWFLYQKQLQYHVQTVHRNSFQINCPDCGKVSKSSENFQSHYRAEHMKPNDTIICRLGNIKFTKFATFIAHLRTEQKKVLHTRDSSEREKHSVVHKPKIQDYPCKWCGKHLPSLAKRKARDTLHMKEKPYLCSLCTKSFTRWMYLRRHEKRMHSINKQNWKGILWKIHGVYLNEGATFNTILLWNSCLLPNEPCPNYNNYKFQVIIWYFPKEEIKKNSFEDEHGGSSCLYLWIHIWRCICDALFVYSWCGHHL